MTGLALANARLRLISDSVRPRSIQTNHSSFGGVSVGNEDMNNIKTNKPFIARVTGLLVAAVAVTTTLLAASGSQAQAGGRVFIDNFRQAVTTEDGFAINRPIDRGHGKFGVSITGDYGKNELVFGQANGSDISIIKQAVTGQMTLSLGLWNRLVLFAGLPVNLWQDGTGVNGTLNGTAFTLNGPDDLAMGDIWFGARIRIAGERNDKAALALQLTGTAPTGRKADDTITYSGERGFTGIPMLLAEVRPGPVIITANVGARIRERSTRFPTNPVNHELLYGLGLTVPVVKNTFNLYAEAYGATELFADRGLSDTSQFGKKPVSPLEAIGGFRYFPGGGFALGAAAGPGLLKGYGNPDFRVIGNIGWAAPVDEKKEEAAAVEEIPPTVDADGDGVADDADRCPQDAEDQDGFEDADGCPDLDNDQDGIADAQDQCPADAEDKDAFQDEDGCPDLDNDQDGIPDANDKAPNDAEDKDGFEDDDGVPDLDNDTDGVPDAQDKCPMAPGKSEDEGCPKAVRIEGNQIKILQRVEFDNGKATIRKQSFPVLEDVRIVLETNKQITKIRVEGHTDNKGKADKNLTLSQQRAESVKDWLVQRGIDAGRIEAAGIGQERPIADNKTNKGRQVNRRVEFHIVDGGTAPAADAPAAPSAP